MVGKAWWQAASWGQEGGDSFDLISRARSRHWQEAGPGRKQALAGSGPWQEVRLGCKHESLSFKDLLPLAKSHPLKILFPPQIVPAAGDQVFK